MKIMARQRLTGILTLIALAAASAAVAQEKGTKAASEQQALVEDAARTWDNFWKDPNLGWFRDHVRDALGFAIAPKIVKAGFIFGGSGGRSVLIAKGTGGWNGPAFYGIGTASVGFQAGVTVSEAVALVMTQKGLDSLMSAEFKLGADATVAAGPVGVGTGGSPHADFIVFTRAKGLYGGVNVEGAVIKPSEDWNQAYYGKDVTPIGIIAKGEARNPGAAELVKTIGKAA